MVQKSQILGEKMENEVEVVQWLFKLILLQKTFYYQTNVTKNIVLIHLLQTKATKNILLRTFIAFWRPFWK